MARLEHRDLSVGASTHLEDTNKLYDKANYVYDVKDFGATGDGLTDDTVAIQACMDEAFSFTPAGIGTGEVVFPPGDYNISSTLTVYRGAGTIRGFGIPTSPNYNDGNASTIRWYGDNVSPMLHVRDSRWLTIKNLRFAGSDINPPTYAIEFNHLAGDSSGSNEWLMVEDVVIGDFPWNYTAWADGDEIQNGIGFTGDNGNNDQFFLERIAIAATNYGIELQNSQTVWGKMTDILFDHCAVGLWTNARTTLINPAFNACAMDFYIAAYATSVLHVNSEATGQFAYVGPYGSLSVIGGKVQTNGVVAGAGVLVDAWPSGSTSLDFRRIAFDAVADPLTAIIKYGPSEADSIKGNFTINIEDCAGLEPEQLEFSGTMWAAVPRSQGTVQFRSTVADDRRSFRNELRNGTKLPGRTVPNLNVWDPPMEGANTGVGLLHTITGDPEGAYHANVGALAVRDDGGVGSTFYVKEANTDDTGWAAISGHTGLYLPLAGGTMAGDIDLADSGLTGAYHVIFNGTPTWMLYSSAISFVLRDLSGGKNYLEINSANLILPQINVAMPSGDITFWMKDKLAKAMWWDESVLTWFVSGAMDLESNDLLKIGTVDHDGALAGFFGTAPVAQPDGVDAATALANLGLLVNAPEVPMGEIYVSTPAATTIGTAGTYVKAAGTTTLETTPAAVGFTMPASNRLTYGGTLTKKFWISMTFSATSSGASQSLGFALAKNGVVADKTKIVRLVATATDEGAGAIHGLFELATDDYVELFVTNETSTNSVQIEHGDLSIVAIG